MKKVAVYTRVSTKKDEQQQSFESQKQYYKEYCIEKGYTLTKVYADKGLSATSAKRTEFLNMVYDAGIDYEDIGYGRSSFIMSNRKPLFNMVIVKDHTRFSRNATDGMELAKLMHQNNVYILFESGGFSTEEKDWELRLQIFFAMAEQESRSLSQKVSWGIKARAKQGVYCMSRLSLGYKRLDDRTYGIIEEEAKLVKEIFFHYTRTDDISKRMGSSRMAKYFNDKGILSKEGRKWSADKVLSILRDTKYYGDVYVQRSTRKQITNSKRTKKNKEDWVLIKNAVPPIIDKETYDLAQEIIEQNTVKKKDGTKVGIYKSKGDIFYRKIKCNKCGANFVRHSKIKTTKKRGREIKYLYMCQNRKKFGTCDQRGISEAVLIKHLTSIDENNIERLSKKLKSEQAAFTFILNNTQNIKNKISEVNTKIDQRVEEINNEKNRIVENLIESTDIGSGMKKLLSEKIDKLDKEIESLMDKKSELDLNNIIKFENDVIKKYEEVVKFSNQKTLSFDDVIKIIKVILVLPDKVFLVTLEAPSLEAHFEQLSKLAENIVELDYSKPFKKNNKVNLPFMKEKIMFPFKY